MHRLPVSPVPWTGAALGVLAAVAASAPSLNGRPEL